MSVMREFFMPIRVVAKAVKISLKGKEPYVLAMDEVQQLSHILAAAERHIRSFDPTTLEGSELNLHNEIQRLYEMNPRWDPESY